jgi:hypothetical protein
MDREDVLILVKMGLFFGSIFTVIVAVAIIFDRASCHARFSGSHLSARYSVIAGCQVNAPGAGWIPAGNYRVIR